MAQSTLSAHIREEKGKGAANKLRRNKQIPAVLYGPNTSPVMLSVSEFDLKTVLKSATGENIVLGLQIDTGKGSETKNSAEPATIETSPSGLTIRASAHMADAVMSSGDLSAARAAPPRGTVSRLATIARMVTVLRKLCIRTSCFKIQ